MGRKRFRFALVRDRFNIEATAQGFVSYPDRFYEQWPFPHPDQEIDPRYYLRSLTPREELAEWLCIRSIVLMDNGKFVEAIQPAAWARQLDPSDYSIKVHLEMTMLLALGILDEKPAWVDHHPVVRPDGEVEPLLVAATFGKSPASSSGAIAGTCSCTNSSTG